MKALTQIFLIFFAINLSAQSPEVSPYSIGEKHIIYSEILEEDREIIVHVPEGFWGMDEDSKNLPITFVLDGESQFLNTVSAIDYLSSAPLGNDAMPRTIVVGIPNTIRNRDLTPTKGILGRDSSMYASSGGGPKFLDFIVSELTPYIDSLYSTSTHRTIIGHSLGGLIVFEALLREREHFNNYLAIDPGLYYDNESYYHQVLDSLRNANLSEENLFIAKGYTLPTFLGIEDIEKDTSHIVKLTKTNEKFIKLSTEEDWNVNYMFKNFLDENHFSLPYPATYEAMKYFYRYYPFKEMVNYYHPAYKEKTDLVARLKAHYKLISKKLGYEVLPMESYINSWAYGFSNFERVDLALNLFDLNIENYPEKTSVYESKGFFLLIKKRDKEAIGLFEKSLELKENEEIRELLRGLY